MKDWQTEALNHRPLKKELDEIAWKIVQRDENERRWLVREVDTWDGWTGDNHTFIKRRDERSPDYGAVATTPENDDIFIRWQGDGVRVWGYFDKEPIEYLVTDKLDSVIDRIKDVRAELICRQANAATKQEEHTT